MAELNIRPPSGSRKNKRIAGRGNSGYRGGTSGKGDKGQNARSGGGVRPGFEGGQMPLYRRIPRKGFSNYPFKKSYDVVNVGTLDKKYKDGETVTLETLKEKKIIKKKFADVKILGVGELSKKLTVEVDKVSGPAREKIEKAGGSVAGAPPVEEAAKAEKPAKTEKTEKPAKAEKTEKPAKAEKAEKPAKAEKTEKPAKAEKTEEPAKAAEPKKAEEPQKAEAKEEKAQEESKEEEKGSVDGE